MGEPKRTSSPEVSITLSDNNEDIGGNFIKLEWAAFVNGGYIIRVKISDPYFNTLRKSAIERYLTDGRRKETPISFYIGWKGAKRTETRKAILTALRTIGSNESAEIEFIGIDPPNFFLNEGTADGRAYRGKVSDVIKRVVRDFAPSLPEIQVTETTDNADNVWYMMRQDPKTFIRSLLDWSSSITPQKTHWVVASVDNKLIIKEQAEIKPVDFGIYHVNRNSPAAKDVYDYEMLADNMISPLQSRLVTSGISAISGEYFDRVTDLREQNVTVSDANTPTKANVNITSKQGFKKPDKEWATSIMAIPEHSAGDIGIAYGKYIDGRARGLFLNMLNLVMRMRARVIGDPVLHDPSQLGVATVTLGWQGSDDQPYFLGGRWLLYGWHHIVTRADFTTDLYLARLDFDSSSRKV